VDAGVGPGDGVRADLEGELLEEERQTHPDNWFRQEYMCEFVQDFEGLFDMDLLDAAFEDR
jgi:hypothetical protein